MARRASTPTILVVNPDGTVGAVFTGDVVARTFHAPSATAQPRVDIDAAGFRVILADGSTAVDLGASALFKGDVFAHALYAPNDSAQPRLEVDVDGLRAILTDGSEGARIVSNTPRPVFKTGLIFSDFDPLFAGSIGVTGDGNWTIASGGDEIYAEWVTVPKGTSLQGFCTATLLKKAGAGGSTVVLQAEESGAGRLGPAVICPVAPTTTASDGVHLTAPFLIDNTAGGADRDVLLGARSIGPATATQRTGMIVGYYG